MRTDPIIEEIHKERETHAAKFGHDLLLRPALFSTLRPKPFEVETARLSRTARGVTRA